jgi:hypothetical protein
MLFVEPDGGPGPALHDKDGRIRATLSALPDGSPRLSLHGKGGKMRAMLSVLSDGGPGLALYDKDGGARHAAREAGRKPEGDPVWRGRANPVARAVVKEGENGHDHAAEWRACG